MRAVWSFWTKPFHAERHSTWHRPWHHWLAWGLSLHTARAHYPDTCLVTDDEGARLLVDRLQLPFRRVSTALNSLADADPEWWALGKLKAYRAQRDPFVHIDTDVFLWKALQPGVSSAGVFAQNPEPVHIGASCYRPQDLEAAIGSPTKGWLPEEWRWYRSTGNVQRAECCGIFGGQDIDFIRHYSDLALRLASHRRNVRGLSKLHGKVGHMILLEQYLLTACVEYHRNRLDSPFRDLDLRYVFPSIEDAFHSDRTSEVGFTHLAAGVKRNGRIARHLERRVRRDLPDHYERCRSFFDQQGFEEAELIHFA